MTVCLDANSGSRAIMHVSQDLGHPTSNATISPFPNVQPVGYASTVEIKRERLNTSNNRTAPSRLPSEARGNSNASRPSGAPPDLLYSQDGVPPTYESLSIR